MICFYAQEMVKFSRYIVAKFFELLPKNPVLLAELVVWKTSGDCYEIVEGYGSLALRYETALLSSLERPRPYGYFDKCAFVLLGLHFIQKILTRSTLFQFKSYYSLSLSLSQVKTNNHTYIQS